MEKVIGRRYAEAFFRLIKKPEEKVAVRDDLLVLGEAFRRKDVRTFFANPNYAYAVKKKFLKTVSRKCSSSLIEKFLYFLLAKNRLEKLPDIACAFEDIHKASLGIRECEVTLPEAPSSTFLKELRTELEIILKSKLEIKTSIDPHMLGGIRVCVGHQMIDLSLKSGIRQIKEKMYQNINK